MIRIQDLLGIKTSLQGQTSPRVCAIVQLLELDVSVLGFPLPFFGRLGGPRCLDVVPLGFFLVRQQQHLGQVPKERGVVNLLQFSNINKLRVNIMSD